VYLGFVVIEHPILSFVDGFFTFKILFRIYLFGTTFMQLIHYSIKAVIHMLPFLPFSFFFLPDTSYLFIIHIIVPTKLRVA
jgi:hypothetical protein